MGDLANGHDCDAFILAFAADIVTKYRSPLLDQTFGKKVSYYVAADDNWEVHLYARIDARSAKDVGEHMVFFHFRVESAPAFYPTSDDIVEQVMHVFPEFDAKEVERCLEQGSEEAERQGVRLLRQFTADTPEAAPPMSLKRYGVRVRYRGVSTFFVEARDEEEAEELARGRYGNGEPEEGTGSEYEEIVGVEVRPIERAVHESEVERTISFEEMVGRTIARLERGTTEGAYGDEPTITLHFTDGTRHTFVLAADFAPGYEEGEDLAIKRVGSPHAEDVIGGRSRCGICGWVDEADPKDPTVRAWHGDSFEGDAFIVKDKPTEATVPCKFCHKQVPEKTAHLHQGEWVGDECGCWDERLRSTE